MDNLEFLLLLIHISCEKHVNNSIVLTFDLKELTQKN